jgi:outer membrane lipoprotein carrier protein
MMVRTFALALSSIALVASTAALAAPVPATAARAGLFPQVAQTAPPPVAAEPTADEVMAGVQRFYAEVGQVTAKFRQEVVNATFGRNDTSDGVVYLKKPGSMRWQYFAKKRRGKVTRAKDFISNGRELYLVDYENRQIVKKDLKKNLLPTAVTFLHGTGELGAEFTPALEQKSAYGGKGDLVLRLLPKVPSAQYKTLHLVVDPSNYRVKESILVDAAGNRNHFRFYEPDVVAPIPDSRFQVDPKHSALRSFRLIDGDDASAAPRSQPSP